jgi:hypothetical protein
MPPRAKKSGAEVFMREESTNTEYRVTTRTEPQANQEMDASGVRDWKPGLKPSRTTGPAVAKRSAKSPVMLPSQEGSTEGYKLHYPAWHKPYAEVLLATDPEILVSLLAAAEAAIFERLLELAAREDASAERQDIGRAIDVMLTLKARKT